DDRVVDRTTRRSITRGLRLLVARDLLKARIVGPPHLPDVLGRGVFAVAEPRDRTERHHVDPAVLQDAVVDVNADDLAEHHRGAVVLVARLDWYLERLPVLAFQRHRRFGDARRLDVPARR